MSQPRSSSDGKAFVTYLLKVPELREYFVNLIGVERIHVQGTKYIIFRGDIPIALVAHIDTIPWHRYNAKEGKEEIPSFPPRWHIKRDEKDPNAPLNIVVAPETGLGADDRAGCMMIATLWKRGHRPWVILTDEEEKGCVGAKQLCDEVKTSDIPSLFFMIQLDRRGQKDAVYYDFDTTTSEGRDFNNLIESYGFKENLMCSSTDIKHIAPKWNMAAVNVSVGYENEHTLAECLHMDWWDQTHQKIGNILKDCKDGKAEIKHFTFQKKTYTRSNTMGGYRGGYSDNEYDWGGYSDNMYAKKDPALYHRGYVGQWPTCALCHWGLYGDIKSMMVMHNSECAETLPEVCDCHIAHPWCWDTFLAKYIQANKAMFKIRKSTNTLYIQDMELVHPKLVHTVPLALPPAPLITPPPMRAGDTRKLTTPALSSIPPGVCGTGLRTSITPAGIKEEEYKSTPLTFKEKEALTIATIRGNGNVRNPDVYLTDSRLEFVVAQTGLTRDFICGIASKIGMMIPHKYDWVRTRPEYQPGTHEEATQKQEVELEEYEGEFGSY